MATILFDGSAFRANLKLFDLRGISIGVSLWGALGGIVVGPALGGVAGHAFGRYQGVLDTHILALGGLLLGTFLGVIVPGLTFLAADGKRPTLWLKVKAGLLRGAVTSPFVVLLAALLPAYFNSNRLRFDPVQAINQSSTGMMVDFDNRYLPLSKRVKEQDVMLAKGAMVKIYTAAAYLYPDQGWYLPGFTSTICQDWTNTLVNKIDRMLTPAERKALRSLDITYRATAWSSRISTNEHAVLEVQLGKDDDPGRKRFFLDNAFTGRFVGAAYDEATQLRKYYRSADSP